MLETTLDIQIFVEKFVSFMFVAIPFPFYIHFMKCHQCFYHAHTTIGSKQYTTWMKQHLKSKFLREVHSSPSSLWDEMMTF